MFDRLNLSDLDLAHMTLIKERYVWHDQQDHSRWIFRCRGADLIDGCIELYLKIWNPRYVRRDNIARAIDAGFYDGNTTPALKALIYQQGVCRGYVMDQCQPVLSLRLNRDFFELIKDKSRETKFFHAQFSPCHVMKYKNRFSLIDLDGVFPISQLTEVHKSRVFFDYEDYERFIVAEYHHSLGGGQDQEFTDQMRNGRYFRQVNPLLRLSQSLCTAAVAALQVGNGRYRHLIEQ